MIIILDIFHGLRRREQRMPDSTPATKTTEAASEASTRALPPLPLYPSLFQVNTRVRL